MRSLWSTLALVPLVLTACGDGDTSDPNGPASASGSGGAGVSSSTSAGASGGGTASAGGGGASGFTLCGGVEDLPAGPFVDWFDEVTSTSGIDVVDDPNPSAIGNGVAVGDLDGDGLLDVVATTGDGGPTKVYRNKGDLTFEDVTASFTGAPLISGYGVVLADLDNDGDPDLIIAGETQNAVYENQAGAQLIDRSGASGLLSTGRTSSLVVGDFDGDGLLDLYTIAGDARLWHGLGSFQWEDNTSVYGLDVEPGQSKWTALAYDYDADGAQDLYVQIHTGLDDPGLGGEPAMIEGDQLFHNDGGALGGAPLFVRKEKSAGIAAPRSSMGAVVADFDGDQRLDLYVANIGRNPLYLAKGDGTFTDATELFGVGATRRLAEGCPGDSTDRTCLLSTWGMALFDADHDGADDLVMVNGIPGGGPHQAQPSAALRGSVDQGFSPVETALGCMNGRSLVPADLDGDGDLDLLVTTINGPVRVFRNKAPSGQGALRVRLQGTQSNRDGIGAVVTATLAGGRSMTRSIGAGGIVFGWAPPEAHFVMAGAQVTALDVTWPSGVVQHVGAVAVDQVLTVVEP